MQHGHGKPPKSSTSRYWDDVMSIPGPPRSMAPPVASSSSSSGASSSMFPQFAAQPASDISKPSKPPKPPSSRSRSSRQFACPLCTSLFERRGHLEAHVETVHEGKRPHRCPHNCGKVFGHRSSLSRHVKSAHENPTTPSASKSKKQYGPP